MDIDGVKILTKAELDARDQTPCECGHPSWAHDPDDGMRCKVGVAHPCSCEVFTLRERKGDTHFEYELGPITNL